MAEAAPAFTRSPDYRVRPAKHVERILIVDALRRLHVLEEPSRYAYVGFGAHFFVDFNLVHRALGVTRMTSLESKRALFERCMFNRPFLAVDVVNRRSRDYFRTTEFSGPTIVWADYTSKLNTNVLGDVDTLVLGLPRLSVVIATVNVEPDEVPDPPDGRVAALEARVGRDAVPLGVGDGDLGGWEAARVAHRIVHEQIERSVATRTDGVLYRQMFNVQYRDTARMLTVGGILLAPDDVATFDSCAWHNVEGVCGNEDYIRIELPTLTMREMAHLDAQLPEAPNQIKCPGLTPDEIAAYIRFYRYYPRYALVDL